MWRIVGLILDKSRPVC